MSLTLEEVAALLEGRLEGGEPGVVISGVAAIADAAPGDITFLGNPKYAPALQSTRATAALVPPGFEGECAAARIFVESPSLAFARVVKRFTPEPPVFAPGIHPSAVIAEGVTLGKGISVQPHAVIETGASIGEGTIIGAHVYVGHGARIGANCHLHPSVSVRERCVLGDRVIVHCGTVIGSDGFGYELSGGRHQKIPQTGIVQIDDDVEIGSNTTIDRARFGRTWIGAGTKIDNLAQIAHNIVTGKHCLIIAQAGIAGSVHLGDYVTIAGQAGLNGHIEIGDRAIVAAQAGVAKSMAPGEVVWGSPAVPMRQAKENAVHMKRLGDLFARVRKLEQLLDSAEKSSRAQS